MARYKDRNLRRYFRGDAAFAAPDIYEFLEAEGFSYAIRLPQNQVLQESIAHLLTRPVGRPPNHVQRYCASFSYQAGSWSKKRRVVAKVEWHPGELYTRVGFIVTNLSRPAGRVTLFYNQRGKAEQYIKEGKNAINWTRLSCRKFRYNAVRPGHRMAAEGMPLPWRWNGSTISLNLGVIWEMSGEAEKERRGGSLTIFVLFAGNLTNGTLP